jgi:hypothetical protein
MLLFTYKKWQAVVAVGGMRKLSRTNPHNVSVSGNVCANAETFAT